MSRFTVRIWSIQSGNILKVWATLPLQVSGGLSRKWAELDTTAPPPITSEVFIFLFVQWEEVEGPSLFPSMVCRTFRLSLFQDWIVSENVWSVTMTTFNERKVFFLHSVFCSVTFQKTTNTLSCAQQQSHAALLESMLAVSLLNSKSFILKGCDWMNETVNLPVVGERGKGRCHGAEGASW